MVTLDAGQNLWNSYVVCVRWLRKCECKLCSVQALSDHKVLLEGTLLKPNMVSAGVLSIPCLHSCARIANKVPCIILLQQVEAIHSEVSSMSHYFPPLVPLTCFCVYIQALTQSRQVHRRLQMQQCARCSAQCLPPWRGLCS